MEVFLPISGDSTVGPDLRSFDEIVASHNERKFIVFDEYLDFYLRVKNENVRVKGFVVHINDNKLISLDFDECFLKLDGVNNQGLYKLNNNFFKTYLFKSSIVMNNGHNNKIIFKFSYSSEPKKQPSNDENEMPQYLQSFQEVNLLDELSAAQATTKECNVFTKGKEFSVDYPIYSPLNMRLRNITIYENNKDRIINNGVMTSYMNNFILTSLDLQVSQQLKLLIEKYFDRTEEYGLVFNTIRLSISDDDNFDEDLVIKPIDDSDTITLPISVLNNDSYSIIYKLPELFVNSTGKKNIKVKVNIDYNLKINNKLKIFDIRTTWGSDISLKPNAYSASATATSNIHSNSSMNLNGLSNSSSQMNIQTPRLASGRFINYNSINKLNNISFKFLENKIIKKKGEEFKVILQIINNSQFPLNAVVYYNNPTKNVKNNVILLSNDFKVPIIQPNETYFVNLKFIGISEQFVQYLNGLKLLDLQTNEIIEIGNSLSILIQ
ncbi:hypothetical protein TPHA_0J03160 [Tetrapisispora phaffii CBS 4417]|uniref:Uncharacterized protein n=1 Tax=Tetrapisispora phaffii (strain ATCC 24235 / CBS 4417 / NBRC 1672 / NRRL Y-8282 / UCD 70-5) TaxID=1071381 RepID=G8BY84_TETPH|nr:hypothetical protein TPHA_0J03160 [Tetrapisispora phaffii CBS 4417]CCE65135.1 hypothetical protein TPHA_0J03160 [Tetrapisispora phaffii CBS 4417]